MIKFLEIKKEIKADVSNNFDCLFFVFCTCVSEFVSCVAFLGLKVHFYLEKSVAVTLIFSLFEKFMFV